MGRRLAALAAALDALVAEVEEGGLDPLDAAGVVVFLQDLEGVRNRLPLVDHRALRDAAARDVAGTLGQGRLTRLLTQALRISAAEAHRRVRASEQVGDRVTALGAHDIPLRPALAAAQRAGRVTPEQVDVVCRGLSRVDLVGYDPLEIARG